MLLSALTYVLSPTPLHHTTHRISYITQVPKAVAGQCGLMGGRTRGGRILLHVLCFGLKQARGAVETVLIVGGKVVPRVAEQAYQAVVGGMLVEKLCRYVYSMSEI